MSLNLFVHAIKNKECYEFFTGKGKYFLLNRDTGEHSYMLMINSHVSFYFSRFGGNVNEFRENFSNYIEMSNPGDINDVNALLRNIWCVLDCEKEGNIPINLLANSTADKIYEQLYDFFCMSKLNCIDSLEELKNYKVYFDRIEANEFSKLLKSVIE